MKHFQFLGLYNEQGWHAPAFVTIDDLGIIQKLDSKKSPETLYEEVNGWFLPGVHNSHSHAFQIAMAGLAESSSQSTNSFWTWRNLMYSLAQKISPDDMEAIAAYAFMQMLHYGITSVAEFHYIHHDQKGRPYNNMNEMGERLLKAANVAGIELCLIPVFYKYSHFDTAALPEQNRFVLTDVDQYLKLQDIASKQALSLHQSCGSGVHSIRAAKIDEIKQIFTESLGPTHIHISEQVKEVEDCQTRWGQTPIEFLTKHVPLKPHHVLVHATHATDFELQIMRQADVGLSLCPSTEANLGDGIFPLHEYEGTFSVGTDSNVCVNPFEDMRLLEYSQRLFLRRRNIVAKPFACTGRNIFHQAWQAGAKACGKPGSLTTGASFTGFVLPAQGAFHQDEATTEIISKLVFLGQNMLPIDIYVKGKKILTSGQHPSRDSITHQYQATLKKLALTS